MQRYLASDLPKQHANHRQSGNNMHPAMPQAVQSAVQLGAYVLEQRGREGAALYVRGLQSVLADDMLEPICRSLQVPMPARVQRESVQQAEKSMHAKSRAEPDMETILKLMQLMKGKDAPDLSALMQLMGKK